MVEFDQDDKPKPTGKPPAYAIAQDESAEDFTHTLSAIPGIILASQAWVVVGIAILVLFGLADLARGRAVSDPLGTVMALGIFLLFASFALAFAAALSATAAALLLTLFNWTLTHPIPRPMLVSLTGGLAGYWPPALIFNEMFFRDSSFSISSMLGLLVVFLSTLFGQTGANWFYNRHFLFRDESTRVQPREFRFKIRHLLVINVWAGLIFAGPMLLAKLVGARQMSAQELIAMPAVVVLWFAIEFLTLNLAAMARRRFVRKKSA